MDYIIDFYQSLDSINLLLFWGVIIVITLLLIFSIIMINKNRKLKIIIAEKTKINATTSTSDIPIKQSENIIHEIEKDNAPTKYISTVQDKPNQNIAAPIKEKSFIAEEYVPRYEKAISPVETIEAVKQQTAKKEIVEEKKPYQKNVLKEMSFSQTSPIGIVKQNNHKGQEYAKAEELHRTLDNNNLSGFKDESMQNKLSEPIGNRDSFNELIKNNSHNQEYLNEVSSKLIEAMPDIDRTEYEIKQEEDAIISYEELMRKKDTIKTVDEEEAVISIEELYRKEKEKTYGITETEKDEKFIDELKNFRNDL